MANANTENKAVAKKTRKKSQETILKQEMRRIQKELAGLDKKIEAFEAMEKEIDAVDKTRNELTAKLDAVKADLVKELGLAS